MKYYTTCRFCHKASFETPFRGTVRYAVRHWAHWDCGIERFGAQAFFSKLHPGQLTGMPWKIAETYAAEIKAAHPTVDLLVTS